MPSSQALHQAFVRFGPEIRQAVAKEWHLTELLLGGEDDARMADEYVVLRQVLICRWLGLPTPAAASAIDDLSAAMADIHPRVGRGSEYDPLGEPPIELAG